jgi:uncharacterized protein (TIGR02145 family)
MNKYLLLIVSAFTLSANAQTPGAGVTDIDGNNYSSVIIGDQEWMAENLRTYRYVNGDSIANILSDSSWNATSSGAWCWFNHDSQYDTLHGKLYNYYTVMDSRGLCPTGWRVPSEADFDSLIIFLDPSADVDTINANCSPIAGGALKEAGTTNWLSPNSGATNSTSFTALGSGGRHEMGWMVAWHDNAFFWTSTPHATNPWAVVPRLHSDTSAVSKYYNHNVSGMSVRCMKDYVGGVGVLENNFRDDLIIFPNPTSGNFSVDLKDNFNSIKVSITDVNGRLIQSSEYNDTQILNLNLNEPSGVYFLTIKSVEHSAVIRLIKQ